VSGVISGVFLVAVAVMIFNVLAWQFFQADAHNRLVREAQQREWERFNERLAIVNVEVGTVYLNFTLKNYGAVASHIVDLFVKFANGTYQAYTLNTWINPGNTTRIIGPSKLKLQLTDIYDFQIGTERGNLFAPAEPSIINQTQPMGSQNVPFTLSFLQDAFEYIREGPISPVTWTSENKKPAWRIVDEKGKAVLFRVNVTSTYKSDVLLLSGSSMLLVTPDLDASTMKIGYRMYVVNEGSVLTKDGQKWYANQFPSGGQWIQAGKSRYVYFSAKNENGTESTTLIDSAQDYNYQNYVAIFYKIKNDLSNTTFGATVAVIAMQIKTTN